MRIAFVALALAAAPALAEPQWGARETVLISGGITLDRTGDGFGSTSISSSWNVVAEGMTFIAGPMLAGVLVGVRSQKTPSTGTDSTTWQLEPMIGGSIELSPNLSLMPRGLIDYAFTSFGNGASDVRWWAGATVPVTLHVPHFFISFGPIAFYSLNLDNRWNVGLRTLIGTWF
jgi:hypothetical protein